MKIKKEIIQEVLKMFDSGVPVNKIAKKMKLTKFEVNKIIIDSISNSRKKHGPL